MSLKTLWEQMAGVQLANFGTRWQRPIVDGQSLALAWNGTVAERAILSFMNRRGVRMLTGLQRADGAAVSIHGTGSLTYNATPATGEAAAVVATNAPIDFVLSLALDAWREDLGLPRARLLVGFNGLAGQSINEFDDDDPMVTGTLGTLIRDNHDRHYQESKRIIPSIEALFYAMIQGEANVSWTREEYAMAASAVYNDAMNDIDARFGGNVPLMLWQTGGYVNSTGNPYGPPLAQADLIRDFGGVMAGPIYPFHLSDQVHPYHEPSIIMAEMGAYVWAKHEQGVSLSMLYGTPTVMGNQVIIPVEGLEPGKSLTFDPVDKYAAYGGLTNRGVEVIGNTVTNVELSGANIIVTASAAIAGQRFQIAMQSADMSSFVDANGRNYAAHRCDIMESSPVDSKILPGTPVKRFVLSGQWDPGAYEVGEDPIDSVVVIGASLMNSMFGRSLSTPHATATSLLAAAGHDLPVYGWATNGAQLADAPSHYEAARAAFPNALILSHFGGGNVTSIRPYPGGQAAFEAGLAGYLAATAGDLRFYPASMSFRDYDDTTFITPANGSKPYNENLLIPWIAANFPHAMAPYGRPKLDYYRRVLESFETWLQADNIHLTAGAGVPQSRGWIIDRVADLLEGITPAEITERVYVAPEPEPEPEPGAYPLSIVNFTGEAFGSEFQAPRNNVFGNAATVNPNPLPNILDVNGATTGLSMSHAYTGNPAIGATAPGRGANSAGNIGGLPAYNGTLLSASIVGSSAYITTGVTMLMTISGAVPGAQYEFGMVGSRNAADVRNTTVTIAGTATTWNTSEATPQERRVTVTAAGDGTIPIAVAPAGAALAYLGGLSIRRLS